MLWIWRGRGRKREGRREGDETTQTHGLAQVHWENCKHGKHTMLIYSTHSKCMVRSKFILEEGRMCLPATMRMLHTLYHMYTQCTNGTDLAQPFIPRYHLDIFKIIPCYFKSKDWQTHAGGPLPLPAWPLSTSPPHSFSLYGQYAVETCHVNQACKEVVSVVWLAVMGTAQLILMLLSRG